MPDSRGVVAYVRTGTQGCALGRGERWREERSDMSRFHVMHYGNQYISASSIGGTLTETPFLQRLNL
ncbi:hypothetical protein BT69DRAFT_995133 [Atractiella rhizophila]|nr:hypothetical protein BT69DRAFT_995133 [Atractiella rhizophila]